MSDNSEKNKNTVGRDTINAISKLVEDLYKEFDKASDKFKNTLDEYNKTEEYKAEMVKIEMELPIEFVSDEELINVIMQRYPLGLYITENEKSWTACDNSTGDAWTEDFKTLTDAVQWLRGEKELV